LQVAHHRHGCHDGNEDNRRLEDDLEGGPADETVQSGIGGTYYEIDLNASNAAAFRRQLAPYIEHACRTGREQRQRPADCVQPARSADIGAWAKEQGIALSDRGRIPGDIVRQHQAAAGGR
jgi:Lsr2